MAENVLYADLNLPEPSRPRILMVPDVQGSGCTYAEVKVKSQHTNAAANCKSSGKSCCSRKCVAVLAVIILVLVLAVCLIITYGPTANSQQESTTLSPTSQEHSTKLPPSHGEAAGCPPPWIKHGRKCYFFSPEQKEQDWNSSRAECTAMDSELVIIESREELDFLHSQSKELNYLLGLTYYPEEKKWKWINNVEHDPAMIPINRTFVNEHCMVIGFCEVRSAPCSGWEIVKNLCEKGATMSKSHQKES